MNIIFCIYITVVILTYYIILFKKCRKSMASVCESYRPMEQIHLGHLYPMWMSLIAMSYLTYYILFIDDIVEVILMIVICNGISLMGTNPKLSRPRHRVFHDIGMGTTELAIAAYSFYTGYQYTVIIALLINYILCIIAKYKTTNSLAILFGYLAVLCRVINLPRLYYF